MKSFVLLFVALVLTTLSACIEKNVTCRQSAVMNAIEPFTDYHLTTRPGYTTILTVGEDTLAVCAEPMSVSVPRAALRNNLLRESWSEDEIYEKVSYAAHWQYLMFEDTRNADYDYNDLVIHVRFRADKRFDKEIWDNVISIQPVAFGSISQIRVGVLYKDLTTGEMQERILVQDARTELFNGNTDFPINTDPTKTIKQVSDKLTPYFELTTTYPLRLVWFIEARGQRFYAATSQLADQSLEALSSDGMPYGLSVTWKINYPIERCRIADAYPGFYDWVRTGNEELLKANRVADNTFPAMENRLWDYTR